MHHASICDIHDRNQLETDLLAHFAAMVRLMLTAASKGSRQSMRLNASTSPPLTQHDHRRSNPNTNFVTRCVALCCCCSCTPSHAFPHPRISLALLRALVLSDITSPLFTFLFHSWTHLQSSCTCTVFSLCSDPTLPSFLSCCIFG